jgi:hypothetical protein
LETDAMRLKLSLIAIAVSAFASAAHAGWYEPLYLTWGNDTGGIIAWSPAIRGIYRTVAAEHCAQYNKVARITSVHPWYGDYVGFVCAFPRGYDPVKAWSWAPRY